MAGGISESEIMEVIFEEYDTSVDVRGTKKMTVPIISLKPFGVEVNGSILQGDFCRRYFMELSSGNRIMASHNVKLCFNLKTSTNDSLGVIERKRIYSVDMFDILIENCCSMLNELRMMEEIRITKFAPVRIIEGIPNDYSKKECNSNFKLLALDFGEFQFMNCDEIYEVIKSKRESLPKEYHGFFHDMLCEEVARLNDPIYLTLDLNIVVNSSGMFNMRNLLETLFQDNFPFCTIISEKIHYSIT